MKKQFLFFSFAFLLLALPAAAQLKVTNSPTGAAVVVTQPSAVFVTWTIESASSAPVTAVSEEGLFVLGNRVLGRVGTFLTTTVAANGTVLVTETLLIPPDVSNRALKLNAPTFFYQRTFRSTSDDASGQSALSCRLSTSAYGNFSIGAITLFFQNQRGEATFEQNNPNARAYAEVRYNGTGLLKAVWEVQEPNSSQFRVLQQINYHLTFGDRVVFESPSLPPLPTVVTGRHVLRFRILEPISGFELPTITYFVKAVSPEETKAALLQLTTPAANAQIKANTSFEWSGKVEAAILKFSVYEKSSLSSILPVSPSVEPLPDSHQLAGSRTLQTPELLLVKGVEVFSAALPTTVQSFTPRPEQFNRLHSDKWYVWQVHALDSSGNVISESALRAFQVAAPASQP